MDVIETAWAFTFVSETKDWVIKVETDQPWEIIPQWQDENSVGKLVVPTETTLLSLANLILKIKEYLTGRNHSIWPN